MEDAQVHGSIEKLVAEEHALWEREAAGESTDEDRRRLESIKVSLDQCWDLLRQRRALREAGRDPDGADVRAPEVVETTSSNSAIFDAFPDDSGRQAHLSGRVAEALMAQAADLFAEPPEIKKADVIAAKMPG